MSLFQRHDQSRCPTAHRHSFRKRPPRNPPVINPHVLPFVLPFKLTGGVQLGGPLRNGAPTAVALAGSIDGSPKRDVVVVAYEWPEHMRVPERKEERERRLIERLNADYRLEHRRPFYEDVLPGPDPPDFHCRHGAEAVGVECTQWVNRERVEAGAAFEDIRSAVLKARGKRFARLRGHVVYVSLPEGGELPNPERVVELLVRHDPAHPGYAGLPESISDHPASRDGAIVVTAAPLSQPPRLGFGKAVGFELSLGYPSVFEGSILWQRFLETVARKDVAGTQHLVISVGAPIASGFAYPGDALGFSLIATRIQETDISASHLDTVLLHVWPWRAIGRIAVGTKGCDWLCGSAGLPDFATLPPPG